VRGPLRGVRWSIVAARTVRAAVLAVIVLPCAGCLLYDDRCGEESRDVNASAEFEEPWDPESGYAQVTLVERRVSEPRESMWWVVFSDSLKGRIGQARLVDTGADFAELVALPVDPGAGSEALSGRMNPYHGPTPFADLFQLKLDRRVALELQTDIPQRELLRQTLIPAVHNDWGRPHCS
jgi:hypothetical protein